MLKTFGVRVVVVSGGHLDLIVLAQVKIGLNFGFVIGT